MTYRNQVYANMIETAFNTPMVRLQKLIDPSLAEVFVKLEYFNPMGSVKDRIGIAMIETAEREGLIGPETHIVEPTSGNTGIGLAFVCAAKGYKLTLTMPETMSFERRTLLKALGANLVLTPAETGMGESIAKAIEIVHGEENAWMPMQFENPANPAIHEKTTGPEIWEDSGHKIDAIVTGVGTGGTITGVTRYLRSVNPDFISIAIEPSESAVISGAKPADHDIQGIGAGFIPRNCDTSLLDGLVSVSTEEAYRWARRLHLEEGIFAGISSGANVCGVSKAIEKYGLQGKRIVTVACSTGERYLTSKLFEDL
ncbi:MAG: cysteine synthase A [Planctomycetota bacterium]|jgi:cysteine synthase A